MRTLNLRLLAILFVGAILTGAVGYGVHSLQVRRNAGVLLRQAAAAKEAENWNEAINCLQRYVSLVRRDNGEVLADLGLLQADARRWGPALRNLQNALRQLPERTDVQRRLAEAAMALRLYTDARQHLEALLKSSPNDPELLELLARCQLAEGHEKLSVDSLSKAIDVAPDRLDAYALLAAIYEERLKDSVLAREILDQMVAKNPNMSKAFVIRGLFRMEHLVDKSAAAVADASTQSQQSLAAALEDANSALELEPDDEGVLLFAVRCFLANRQADEARKYADHAKDLFPKNPSVYALLADIELQTNHRKAAIDWLDEGVKVAPKSQRQDLLWNLCNLYLEENELDEEHAGDVRSLLAELRKSKYPKPPIDYLEARLLTVQRPRQWLEASIKLEKNRAELVPWPDLLKQSDYLLGRCYEGMGNPDLQLTAFRRAASVDPVWVPARLGVAGALASMGNVDEALREYGEIVKLTNNNLGVSLQMARLMIMSNLGRLPDERDWDSVMGVLDQIDKIEPNTSQVAILRAEVLLAQGKATNAIDLLHKARDLSPQDLELWLGLAAIAEQRGELTEALRIVDDAQTKNGDVVQLRLARARFLVNQGGPGTTEAVRKLAEPSPEFTSDQVMQLYSGMAGLLIVLEDYDETARLCQAVAKARPSDLLSRLMLFDTAIRATKWSEEKRLSVMSGVLDEMLEIGGKSPLWHYGMAVQLRIRAEEIKRRLSADTKSVAEKKTDTELRSKYFKDAKQHLVQAGAARRAWSRVPLLLADINMEQGDEQAALEYYLDAIQRGELNPAVLSRTISLLYRHGKVEEANQLILRLEQQSRSPFSNEMARLATEISLQLRDRDRALDLATNRFKPTNADEYIWAGQIFANLGKLIDAEESFRKAIEFDETRPEPWIALIQFLGRTEQSEKAAAEFERAERKIDRNEVSAALARCIEFTGKGFDEMEARSLSELSASPNDVTVLRRAIDFYLHQQKQRKAEPLLQQIISGESNAGADDKSWARRNMALALTSRGDRASLKRALALLDENIKLDTTSIPDRRAKAMVLSMPLLREREYRLEAIELLEGLLRDPRSQDKNVSAEERFVLAQLYMAMGDAAKVTSHMRTLLTTHGDVKRYVELYAKFLISRGEVDEAQKWTDGLERGDDSQKQDVFSKLSFSIEGLFVKEKYDELLSAANTFVDEPALEAADRRARIRRTATLLEAYAERLKRGGQVGAKPNETTTALSVRFLDKADEMYRRNARDNPQELLALAGFCSRRDRLDEALEILERAWSTGQPGEITAVAVTIMISAAATPQQLTRLEKLLRTAIEKQKRHVLLVQALADLQSWREEYDEAEALYRESLSKGDHPLALNNLALMLALLGKGGDEPLRLIEKAIELVGLEPSLLDSRATINLALGNPQLAVSDLILAIEKRPSPLNYFHQAQVALRLGQKESARNSMLKADELNLQAEHLHPLERKNYLQLLQELR